MSKEPMISMHPEHAMNISIGKKTLELRTWIPKKYVGWVYVYITKAPPTIAHFKWDTGIVDWKLNGKVAFRFWFDYKNVVDLMKWKNRHKDNEYYEILSKACVDIDFMQMYFGNDAKHAYAWHIEKLEIFDKPKELKDFGLKHAPQKCVWIQGGEI